MNPNEKPPWLMGGLRRRGLSVVSFDPLTMLLENYVLSMMGGSGSLMEAAIQTGRSCVMFESNGLLTG